MILVCIEITVYFLSYILLEMIQADLAFLFNRAVDMHGLSVLIVYAFEFIWTYFWVFYSLFC